MEFLIFCLSVSGLCLIICTGEIFRPLREFIRTRHKWLGKLVCCPMCLGTWMGWLVRFTMLYSAGDTFRLTDFFYGPIGSIVSWYLLTIIGVVEELDVKLTAENKKREEA